MRFKDILFCYFNVRSGVLIVAASFDGVMIILNISFVEFSIDNLVLKRIIWF